LFPVLVFSEKEGFQKSLGRRGASFRIFRIARPGWIPEEASSAQPLRFGCIGFNGKPEFPGLLAVSTLFALTVGLMKPQRGSTQVVSKEKKGGQVVGLLERYSVLRLASITR